jgi:hypothetical protein
VDQVPAWLVRHPLQLPLLLLLLHLHPLYVLLSPRRLHVSHEVDPIHSIAKMNETV